MPEPMLTPDEVAEWLNTTRQHVYALMRRGLPSVKVGRCRRFDRAKVEAWLEREVAA